jgi:phage FluMu gp28-like protein
LERLGIEGSTKYAGYPKFQSQYHVLTARSGHLTRTLRGQEATHIVVDEAAFVPEELVQATLWPMLATTDGEMTLISTPNGHNFFFRLFALGEAGLHGIASHRGPTSENHHVNPAFLAAQRKLVSERSYRAEYEAEFMDTAGSVFKSELVDAALTDEIPEPRGEILIGLDWGRFNDYSAYAVVFGTRQLAFVEAIGRIMRSSWKFQIECLEPIFRRYLNPRVKVDATGMGEGATEMLQDAMPDLPISRFTFNRQRKEDLVHSLVSLFERGALRMRPDQVLLSELKQFRYRDGKLEGQGEHDDLVMALALAVHDLPHDYSNGILVGDPKKF